MKSLARIFGLTVLFFLSAAAYAQSSGLSAPPPPYCTSSNPGAIYTDTGTAPPTVYTCSYYNLAWQWVINPSYGGLVYYPTLPATCSGALPAFLAGWPNTQMYVCVNGVPDAIGGAESGVTSFSASALSWPSWLVPTVTNSSTTPSLAVSASTIPIAAGGTGATTSAGALANLGALPLAGGTITGNLNGTSANFTGNLNVTGSGTFGSVNGVINAALMTGSDIGAKINAAWASCGNACEVYVPLGTYNYSTTINFPMATNGAASLVCDPGATLTYTAAGDAFVAFGTGQSVANVFVRGCQFFVTSSAQNILHLGVFSGGNFENIQATGATNGNGVFNEGANIITFTNPIITSNKYGIHNVGYVLGGGNYAPNKIMLKGGQIGSNSSWGVLEDGSLSATTGPSQNNTYETTFERNGSSGSGQIFVQRCDNCQITHSYIETYPTDTLAQQILLGDATYQAKGTIIRDNLFLSAGSHQVGNTIVDSHSLDTLVDGNIESGIVTNFYYHGTTAQQSVLGCSNLAQAATALVGGVDTFIDAQTCNASGPFTNSQGVTTHGFGFNTLAGLTNDLIIRTRNGGTYDVVGKNSAGSTTWYVTDAGQGYFYGLDAQSNGITDAGPISGVSNFYAPTGVQNFVNTHFGVSGSNNHSTVTQTQDKLGTAGCTTAATIGASCTTTITWSDAFADAAYDVQCTGVTVGGGSPVIQNVGSKLAGSAVVQTVALTAVAAGFSSIDCRGWHQ